MLARERHRYIFTVYRESSVEEHICEFRRFRAFTNVFLLPFSINFVNLIEYIHSGAFSHKALVLVCRAFILSDNALHKF